MIERAGKLREERFIIKVVEMHYKQGLSQQEIGKKLNVSRTRYQEHWRRLRNMDMCRLRLIIQKIQQLILKDDWKNDLV